MYPYPYLFPTNPQWPSSNSDGAGAGKFAFSEFSGSGTILSHWEFYLLFV